MPDMLNPKLTASWEKGLDMVAKKGNRTRRIHAKTWEVYKIKIWKIYI